MSHLGELLTAFLDGELTGAEQDRVTGHLVRCKRCRTEASALREVKSGLAALAGSPADASADLAERLLAVPGLAPQQAGMAMGAAGPIRVSVRRRARRIDQVPRRPGGSRGPRAGKPRPSKRRYVVLGTVSVVVGLGAAAFSVGGGDPGPGPRIIPPVELYSEEHAINTGEVPFTGPAGEMASLPAAPDRPGSQASHQKKTTPHGQVSR